ncbi:hypothetical protein F511_00507 [Dorcoceras hygrometricum]|uniref:RING-type domain-containing protein n=1 Tax=Dorcoceras hygrometricum TaxID=472368 RepID=A0A2Z7BB30_9LAMI|nr:hypothetical protein F511_00507 [Dorcoceras hygrometricum]
MDARAGGRGAGGPITQRKGSTVAFKVAAAARDENVRFCNRIGCSGRIKYSQTTDFLTLDRTKYSRPSCSSHGNAILGTSSKRNSVMTSAKKFNLDSRRKLPSQSESSVSGDSLGRSPTYQSKLAINNSEKTTVTESGSLSVSSNVRPRKPNTLPSSSDFSASKSIGSGPSKSSTLSRYSPRILKSGSKPVVVSPSCSSVSNSVTKNAMRKISHEMETSSSRSGRKTMALSSSHEHVSPSTSGISISNSRRNSSIVGGDSSATMSVRTRNSGNTNKRMRPTNRHNRQNFSSVGRHADTETPENALSSDLNSYSVLSSNGDNTSTLMYFSSEDLGFNHLRNCHALPRDNLDGIAEVLLALERIEHSMLTHEEEFEVGDEVGTLIECDHSYHITCITHWLSLKNWCPICKDTRSGAGGKIVANRRKQRLATTPYDRPPTQPPPDKSPSWFSGRILPSARALASGAGKILASVLYSESSSSSEDEVEESGADGLDNVEDAYDGLNASHERIEAKRIIERLIMQETFSRDECDRLTELLKSRVIYWSSEAERGLAPSPGKMTENEVGEMYDEAVLEAKKWFQEKKMGPNSLANIDKGTCDLSPSRTEHVNYAVGSPLDVARSYMRDRPPWASPTKQIESSTPLTARMEMIKEGTSYLVGHDSLSSSKKRKSVASGSWNIQEELRRVRAKATEDMLRTPSSRIDPSLFGIANSRLEGMGKKSVEPGSFGKTHQIGVLMDAGVSSDPALAALESRQDVKSSEALSSKPANLSSGNNEDSKGGHIDGESFKLKLPCPTSSKSEELPTGSHGLAGNEITEIGRTPEINGFSLSQTSLSGGGVTSQNHEQENEHSLNTNKVKTLKAGNLEGRCELLTEACVEVPIVTETASIASGSQNSLNLQHEELSEEMIQSTDGRTDLMRGKQQPKKSTENLRRSKRRGK